MRIVPARKSAPIVGFCAVATLATLGACAGTSGNTPHGGGELPPASSTSSSASAARLTPTQICDRICAAQTKCGGESIKCQKNCVPIIRVLDSDVGEGMMKCRESHLPTTCNETAEQAAKDAAAGCIVDLQQGRAEHRRATIEVFAKAWCETTATCGVEGSFSLTNCLGAARGAIMTTNEMYGSLRGSVIDEIVVCMKAPCDKRAPTAEKEVSRCLSVVLEASGAPEPASK